MNVASKLSFPPIPLPSTRFNNFPNPYFSASTNRRRNGGRKFPLSGAASIPFEPINIDFLEEEFNGQRHGVTFEAIGDECIAKLRLDNGGFAIVMIPSGLITSYKAPMWHGGSLELLHSSVSEDTNGCGGGVVQGGVLLDFKCKSDELGVSWSPRNWELHNVGGNPQDSIQVELISSDLEGMVEFKYIVTLKEAMLISDLIVSNKKQTSLSLTGSILSHLTVSTPEATFAVGLEGSNFHNRAPFSPSFAIIPPDYGRKKGSVWDQAIKEVLPGWGKSSQISSIDKTVSSQIDGEESEDEELDNYKQLTEQMSRIYTSAPQNFTIIDRGRRNSVVVERRGFDELYMFSPGSSHVYYGEYSYICIGQSAILKPIVLGPQQVWRGYQLLFNPNL